MSQVKRAAERGKKVIPVDGLENIVKGTPAERLRKVTLPLTRGGMLSGSVLVFVPSVGEFLVPELLGGAKTMLVGKFIALKFTGLRHWPLGAAYALVLVSLIVLLLLFYLRLGGSTEAFQAQAT